MKYLRIAALLAVMAAVPSVALAQSTSAPKAKHTPKVATTTMTGLVKSVDDTSMVLTRANGKGPESSFQLNASTTRKGNLVSGDIVSVRYFVDHGQKVATAVTVTKAPPKSGSGK
jgi:hypothetical protein